MRNSGKVLLGSLLQERGAGISTRFPFFSLRGGSWFLIVGEGKSGSRGQDRGVTEGLPTPLAVLCVCRGHVQFPVFAPGSPEVAVGFFWSFCVLLSIICPNCACM